MRSEQREPGDGLEISPVAGETRRDGGGSIAMGDPIDSLSNAEVEEVLGAGTSGGATARHPHPTDRHPVDPPHDWESPIPIDAFVAPPFPTSALPAWLREFVEAEAIATQTPPDLAAMLAISVCAAAVAKAAEVEARPGWREPLNLFTATVLPPGNRKSAVLSDVIAPLEEYGREEIERTRTDVALAENRRKIREAALAKAQKDAASRSDRDASLQAEDEARRLVEELSQSETLVAPRLLVDDATPEALASLLTEQRGRMAVLSAEGSVFDLMAGRYSASGGPNLDVYLKGHSGDNIRVDRKGRASEFIHRPALTIGLAIQPAVLREIADRRAFRGKGLLARFLYSLPESTLGRRDVAPPPLPYDIRERYGRNVRALLTLTGPEVPASPHVLSLSSLAEERFRLFQEWVEPQLGEFGELGTMADWGGKIVGAVARIAGVLHLARHAGEQEPWAAPIQSDTLVHATEIGKYLIAHARAAFARMGSNPAIEDARHVWRWVEACGELRVTRRDIHRGTRGRIPKVEDLEKSLSFLVDRQFLRPISAPEPDGPGRPPSQAYEVNPYALREAGDGQYGHNAPNTLPESNCVHSVTGEDG